MSLDMPTRRSPAAVRPRKPCPACGSGRQTGAAQRASYTDRFKWDGGSTGLNVGDALSSLGLNNVQNTNVLNSYSQNDGQHIGTDEIRARDAGGLKIFEDSGTVGLFVKDDGNVGVGTTDPTTRLAIGKSLLGGYTSMLTLDELNNTGANSMGIDWRFAGGSGYPWGSVGRVEVARQTTTSNFDLAFHTTQAGVLSEKLRILGNGSVGIGTTSPNALLHVANGAALLENNTDNLLGQSLIFRKSRGGAGTPTAITGTDDIAYLKGMAYVGTTNGYQESSRITFDTEGTIGDAPGGAPGVIRMATVDAGGTLDDRMFIDSDGNVGIGTTNPSDKLHVTGKIRATHVCFTDGTNCKDVSTSWGSGGTVTSVGITAPAAGITSSGGPVTTSGAITLALANDLAAVEGISGTGITVRTAADTWGTITDNSGNWNTAYTDRLKWDGGTSGLNVADARTNLSINNVQNINVQNSFTQADAQYFGSDEIRARDAGGLKLFDDSGAAGLFVEDGGEVGIGTDAPERLLDIRGVVGTPSLRLSTGQVAIVANDVTNTLEFASWDNNPGSNLVKATIRAIATETHTISASGTRLSFSTTSNGSTSTSERLVIDQNGYVGIGNATPGAPLDVVSSSNITSGSSSGSRTVHYANPGAASSALFYGQLEDLQVYPGNGQDLTGQLFGEVSQAQHAGTGTVSNLTGLRGNAANVSSGTINTAVGVNGRISLTGAGSIIDAYGVVADAADSGAGAITNFYGVYVPTPTVAGTNYSIFVQGGVSHFGGNVGIGTTNPQDKLHVDGKIRTQQICYTDGSNCRDLTTAWPVIGSTAQAHDAGLTSIAGLTTSADQMIYATGSDTYATTALTAAGRALLDDADAGAQRTTLGLGNVQNINVQNNFTQNDGQYLATDEIRARDAGGLKLFEDSGVAGLFVEDSGFVGIGNTDPLYQFHVSSGDSHSAVFDSTYNSGGGAGAGILIRNTASGGPAVGNSRAIYFGANDTGDTMLMPARIQASTESAPGAGSVPTSLEFFTGSNNSPVERMVIESDGDVGIGTTSPQAQLHVTSPSGTATMMRLERATSGHYNIVNSAAMTSSTNDLLFDAGQASSGFLFRPRNASNALVNGLGIDRDGKVGIGTTTPSYKFTLKSDGAGVPLAVQRSSDTNSLALIGETGGGAGYLNVYNGATAGVSIAGAGTSYFNAGNVGMGTTSPGSYRLNVKGGDNYVFGIDNDGSRYTAAYWMNNGTVGGGVQLDNTGNNFRIFGNGAAQKLSLGTQATDRLTIDTDGKIGIGKASPQYLLDVEQTATSLLGARFTNISDTAGAGVELMLSRKRSTGGTVSSGDTLGSISFRGQDTGGLSKSGAAILALVDGVPGAYVPGRLQFHTADTSGSAPERMRINSDGNVGIGTTSPDYALEVEKSGGASINIKSTGADSAAVLGLENDARRWGMYVEGLDADKFYLRDYTASATRMVIDSDGKVGIGVTNPSQTLTVIGNNASNYALGVANQSATGAGIFAAPGTDTTYPGLAISNAAQDTTRHAFFGNGDAHLAWAGGKVGVGTVTPDAKLHVAGDIKLGNSSATCNATTEGSQRYNSSTKIMEFCDGSNWLALTGDMVKLGTFTASNSATASFTGFTTSYRSYIVKVYNAMPATDAVEMEMHFTTDNGSTWKSGASDYDWAVNFASDDGTDGADNGNEGRISLTRNTSTDRVGSTAGEGITGSIEIYDPMNTSSAYRRATWHMAYYEDGADFTSSNGAAEYRATTAVNGVRLRFSSGNISSGTFVLYGLR